MIDDVNDDEDNGLILRDLDIFFKDGFIYVLDVDNSFAPCSDGGMKTRFWTCYRHRQCECRIQTGINDHIIISDCNFHTHVPEDIQMHMSVNSAGEIVVSPLSIKPYRIDERAVKASFLLPHVLLVQVKSKQIFVAAHVTDQSTPNMSSEHQPYSPLRAYKRAQEAKKADKPEPRNLLDIEETKESDEEELVVCGTMSPPRSGRLSKTFITEFLELFRSRSCLWDTGCSSFFDRRFRNEALDVLADKLREAVPGANRELAVRKINHFRSSFKNELIRRENPKVRKPRLWYFDNLRFLTAWATVPRPTRQCRAVFTDLFPVNVPSTSYAVNSVRSFPRPPELLVPRPPSPEQTISPLGYGPPPAIGQLQSRQEREEERQLDAMMATIRNAVQPMGAHKWPYLEKMIMDAVSAVQYRDVGPFTRVSVYEEEPIPENYVGIGQPCLQCCSAIGVGERDDEDEVDDGQGDEDGQEDDDEDEYVDVEVDEDEKDGSARPEFGHCPCNLT